ncbi:redox-sensitive transcriptional activator SoxR [Vibrio metschnikovii]|nr:redox-sensitive transcriptional activator SoxR [Vibrio metschnikovii]
MSLAEIQQALATLPDSRTPTQKDWQALSAQWKQRLDERIAGLEKLRDTLDGCIGCGCLSMQTCPLYNPEDKLAKLGTGPVLLEQCHIK